MSQIPNLPEGPADLNYLLIGVVDPHALPRLQELSNNLEESTNIMSQRVNRTQLDNVDIHTVINVNGEPVPGEWKLSAKLYRFLSKDISRMKLTHIPGIGVTTGQKLRDKNITPLHIWKAFWYFLEIHPDDDQPFKTWMHQVCYFTEKSSSECYCAFYISYKVHTSIFRPN